MKKVLLFCLLLLINIYLIIGQSQENKMGDAASAGMGNIGTFSTQIYAAQNNQAGLGFLEQTSFSIYNSRAFMVNGVNTFAGLAAIPASFGTVGLAINYYGYEAYNEQKIGISYARKLSPDFALGIQFDYLSTNIKEYGQASGVTVELGLLYFINKDFRLGVHFFNPVQSKIGDIEEPVPAIAKIALAVDPSEKVTLAIENELTLRNRMNFKGGIEYRPDPKFKLRTGVTTEPFTLTFGLGLQLSTWQFDLATGFHQYLGLTPHLSIIYSIKGKK
jgi:long-subunit fatty acid transport protein